MLLACSSCNSKYLVNSVELKPKGRIVQCAICGHEWFQKPNLPQEEVLEPSIARVFKKEENNTKQEKILTSNLPSTYIKEDQPSIINTFLVLVFLSLCVVSFWFIKSEGSGILALLNFYIQEFYFNLKLIINDLVKLVDQIIN